MIIELSLCGSVCACWNKEDHETIVDDFSDCTSPGDSEPACRYVLENYDIDWRIVKQIDGKYQNVSASDDDKRIFCETVYFDSETDFSDSDNSELYLIWEAAHQLENEEAAHQLENENR